MEQEMLNLINSSCIINDKRIVDDINFNFEKGKLYALTGPNGGGKTSLGKMISGLYPISTGSITFEGSDISKLSIDERSNLGIAYSFQIPIYFKGLTVRDLLILAGKSEDESYLCNLLSYVGLCGKDYLSRDVDDRLSGGEIKRIEIATVLAKRNTKLFIFDEPESGIDLWSFKELLNIFEKLKDANKTLIIISHQEKLLSLSDYILVIKDGKIEKHGPSSVVFPQLKKCDKENNCSLCIKQELY